MRFAPLSHFDQQAAQPFYVGEGTFRHPAIDLQVFCTILIFYIGCPSDSGASTAPESSVYIDF